MRANTNPVPLAGDLLLAHELAHTIQQRGALMEAPAAGGMESDATLSAIGVVLPGSGFEAAPALRGGLGLRRCGTGEEPAPSTVSEEEYTKTITELRQAYKRRKALQDGQGTPAELTEVDGNITRLLAKVRGWGVQLSDRQLQRAVESGDDVRESIGKPLELVDPEDMAERGFFMVTPPGEPTVGRTYELTAQGPLQMLSDGSTTRSYGGHWYVKKPGESAIHGLEGWTGATHSWTLDAAGEWEFVVQVHLGGQDTGWLSKTVTVVDPAKLAEEKLNKINPSDLTQFYAGLEYQHLLNIHGGVVDQQFGTGTAYISLEGVNPADYKGTNILDIPNNIYTAHPATGVTATAWQWSAVPADWSPYATHENFSGTRRVVRGREAIDLGTGTTARWLPVYSGIVEIYCAMTDATGAVTEARYRQVGLTSSESEKNKKFQSYASDARDELKKIREDTAVYVAGVHVAKDTGTPTELTLFLGTEASGSGMKLLDVTPAVPRRDYGGADFAAALQSFNSGNSYPEGNIRLRIPQNKLGVTVQDWTLETHGASMATRLSTVWGWESLGLAGLGVLAAIVPGAEPLAPVFFMASAGLGAASAGAALYQQSFEPHPDGLQVAINVVSLAGSLLGLAGAANILRAGPRLAALTKVGRFVLYTGFVTDAVGGVLILAQGAEEIAAILDGPGSADAKSGAITRILAGLLLNGTMLAWGARDLGKTRRAVTDVLGTTVSSGISTTEMHMLSVLEGPSLARLRGAPLEEVQSVAALIREDPVRASSLVERYGEQFVIGARSHPGSLEELAQALQVGAPEAAGTRGTYGPAVAGKPRPAYEEVPSIGKFGSLSPSTLSDRVVQTFTKSGSPEFIPLAKGAKLRPLPSGGGKPTNFELVIPAEGPRAEMIVPVSIETTATRPTSVHGAETGPARMEIRSRKDNAGVTQYDATIEVHENLAKTDVGFAVGHELDELALIAASGKTGTDITAQKRASLLRAQTLDPTAPVPATTFHDTAQARDFKNFVDKRVPAGGRAPGFAMPDDVVTRALDMGFGNTAFLEEKLSLLRSAGVDPDMLERLRTMAYGAEASAAIPAKSPLASSKLIGHLLHEEGGSNKSPVGGLHLDSAVLAHQAELVAKNEPIHLLLTADSPRTAGGVTYKAYEQWVWKGGGAPGPRPTAPAGVAGANVGGWVLAVEPKTTFNSLVPFVTEAQAAWDVWRAANPTASGANVAWQAAAGSGRQTMGGYVDLSGPNVDMRSAYPVRTGGLASW